MAEIYTRSQATQQAERVSGENPFPVFVSGDIMPPVAGFTVTREVEVPGAVQNAAYESGDAFGTMITFANVFRLEKPSGCIVGAYFIDYDDEGVQKDLVLFTHPFTGTADNAAFAVGDVDARNCKGALVIDSFVDCGGFRVGREDNVNMWINAASVNLYAQLITRGADNLTTGSIPPRIAIIVVPD